LRQDVPGTFEEDPSFTDKALRLLGEDSIQDLQLFLWEQPDAGDVILGSGGCRKLRWAAKGHGKRGGAWVIYYWVTEDHRILLLDLYAKNESENLSAAQLKALKAKKP
jgi:hypothetical protein